MGLNSQAFAINNHGDVAFSAILDNDFPNSSIYVGPDPKKDRVIGDGDKLDGATIGSISFCEEGLNDTGQVAFIATLNDPGSLEPRTAVFRATPKR